MTYKNGIIAITLVLLMQRFPCLSQTVLPLHADSIPGALPAPDEEWSETGEDGILRIHKVSRPTLTAYLPLAEKRTGAAVIICPGGGYQLLAAGHEGADVAKRLNQMGVAAFVLKYRIPDERQMQQPAIAPLQDAQRALQLVRENAGDWQLDRNRIGLLGFSAGGHLASTAGTQFNDAVISNPKNTSLRPDFLVLVYPVISFQDPVAHAGSRSNLLGRNPSPALLRKFSNELQVTSQTPPSFLVHAKDDEVKVENSLLFSEALKKYGVPTETLLFEKGGHGYGLYNKTSDIQWIERLEAWLKQLKFLE